MRRYTVSATVRISLWAEVDANSAAEAREKAAELEMPMIQVPGRTRGEDEWDHSGEIDGTAKAINARLVR